MGMEAVRRYPMYSVSHQRRNECLIITSISFLTANNQSHRFQGGVQTHEIGQISKAIPFSLHICINLGCFTKENLVWVNEPMSTQIVC